MAKARSSVGPVVGAMRRARLLARLARKRAVELPLNIDPAAALRAVQKLRQQYPEESNDQLARRIVQRRMWTPAAIGFVTGAPSSPWTAPVLAAADVSMGLRHHVETACQVAVLYDGRFFEREGARWEVLVPILGASQEARMLEEARDGFARPQIRKRVWQRVRALAVRRLTSLVVKKALLAKSLPVVGGVIGGVWGLSDSWTIADRILAYFGRAQGQGEHEPSPRLP